MTGDPRDGPAPYAARAKDEPAEPAARPSAGVANPQERPASNARPGISSHVQSERRRVEAPPGGAGDGRTGEWCPEARCGLPSRWREFSTGHSPHLFLGLSGSGWWVSGCSRQKCISFPQPVGGFVPTILPRQNGSSPKPSLSPTKSDVLSHEKNINLRQYLH